MKNRFEPVLALLAATALSGFAASAAQAQVPGTYAGVTSQGKSVEVVIGTGPDGVTPQLISSLIYYDLQCEVTGRPASWNFGVGGPTPLSASQGFSFESNSLTIRTSYAGGLQANGSFAGTLQSISALLVNDKAPFVAERCSLAAPVTWVATFVGTAATGAAVVPRSTNSLAIEVDRKGRVVRQSIEQR